MTAALSDPAPTSMLDRFTVIIDCFGGGAQLLTLDEIAGRTGLPRSSAHRILEQLVRLGWLTWVCSSHIISTSICYDGKLRGGAGSGLGWVGGGLPSP